LEETFSLATENFCTRKDDDLVGKDRCLAVCNETGVLALAKGVEIVIAWLKYIQESTEKVGVDEFSSVMD